MSSKPPSTVSPRSATVRRRPHERRRRPRRWVYVGAQSLDAQTARAFCKNDEEEMMLRNAPAGYVAVARWLLLALILGDDEIPDLARVLPDTRRLPPPGPVQPDSPCGAHRAATARPRRAGQVAPARGRMAAGLLPEPRRRGTVLGSLAEPRRTQGVRAYLLRGAFGKGPAAFLDYIVTRWEMTAHQSNSDRASTRSGGPADEKSSSPPAGAAGAMS